MSACNIAFQVKDSMVKIVFDECCGGSIDSLYLFSTKQSDDMNSYDILGKDGDFYYHISIHDKEGSKIDMVNNGWYGPDFVRYDENAQQIGPDSAVQTCEHSNKVIEFWTFLDRVRIADFKRMLQNNIPNYQNNRDITDDFINPYIKKAQCLALLKRFNDAIIVYESLLDKSWGKYTFLYKELADCYWQEGNRKKAKEIYLNYIRLEPDNANSTYIKERIN